MFDDRNPLLMIPGPIEVSPKVLEAAAKPPPSHVSPACIEAFGRSLEAMRAVWKALEVLLPAGLRVLHGHGVAPHPIGPMPISTPACSIEAPRHIAASLRPR